MPLVAGLFTHSFGSRAKDGQNRVRRRSAVTPRTVFDVVPRSRNRSVSGHFSTATAPVSRDLRCFFFLSPPPTSDHLKYREICDGFHLDCSGLARCSLTFFFLNVYFNNNYFNCSTISQRRWFKMLRGYKYGRGIIQKEHEWMSKFTPAPTTPPHYYIQRLWTCLIVR